MKLVICSLFIASGLMVNSVRLFSQVDMRLMYQATALNRDTNVRTGPKYEDALKIYNKLYEARGDRRFPAPEFRLDQNVASVAYCANNNGINIIGLEERAYDFCMKYGPEEGTNLLAALLGHELTHFYEKHQWTRGFAYNASNEKLDVVTNLKSLAILEKVNNETQADYLGGFLAYSAGYQPFNRLADFFGDLYQNYWEKPVENGKMQDYPDLADRQRMAANSVDRLNNLIDVFEMANLLQIMGRYESARMLYKQILIDYQGREIYNNIGVLTILEALTYFKPESPQLKYRVPLELELNFANSKAGFGDPEQIGRDLLREAIMYLDNATTLDSTYAPAYLNKACAYYLLGDMARARFYAGTEAKGKAEAVERFRGTVQDAEVLLALIEANTNKEQAVESLAAMKATNSLANYNWYKMTTGKEPPKAAAKFGDGPPEGIRIDGLSRQNPDPTIRTFSSTRANFKLRREQQMFGKEGSTLRVWKGGEQLKHSKIYEYTPPKDMNKTAVYIQITDADYPGDLDIVPKGRGTSREDLIEEFGTPEFTLRTPVGEVMRYPEVIFILQDGKLARWANYL